MLDPIGWKNAGDRTTTLPLWDAPGDDREIEVFRPERRRSDWTVVCLAGGGYRSRSWHEGSGTALWLAMNGVAAVSVPYRTQTEIADQETLHPQPLRDVCRGIRVVRDHIDRVGGKADRVCVLGYSAGGHLSGSAALLHAESEGDDDLAATWPGRPDACAMIYPVVSLVPPCHQGSSNALLGTDAAREIRDRYSLQTRVTGTEPPAFIVHAQDDRSVPLEGAMALSSALRKAGVSVASHVFPEGGHGFGLAQDRHGLRIWPELFLAWLDSL